MSENKISTTITLTHSLAIDPRTHFEDWLEDVETQARHLCPQHDITGALCLVATDRVWTSLPDNTTNAAQVLAGTHPRNIRARPTWDMPTAHSNSAAAAVVSLYKEEAARHRDFTIASSALATALLDSVGEVNRNILKTAFPTLKTYMLSPRQVIDTMTLKHGVATSDDVSALTEPLSRALTSLSDLPNHMNLFLLASQKLTRSGQGKTDFDYFKLFLETVSGFPSVALCMPGYYLQYPAILQQSLATLFPYLEKMQDHLVRSDPASPFSGAAKGNTNTKKTKKTTQRPPRTHTKQQHQQQQHPNSTRWGPNGPVVFSAAAPPIALDIAHYVAENQRLHAAMTAMGGSPSAGGHFGMPVPPMHPANAYLSSTARPRQFYCWLHGYNNTHNGCHCNVMGANPEYTSQMKAATSPNGTGGNPKVGVPVCLQRNPVFYPLSCLCLSSSLSPLPFSSQDSGPISAPLVPDAPAFPFASSLHCAPAIPASPPALLDKNNFILSNQAYANDDIRAPALPAALNTSEAQSVPCVRKGTGTSLSVSWSSPPVTAVFAPLPPDSPDCSISLSRSPAQQHRIRQNITRQDQTRPKQTRPPTVSPTTPSPSSRFAHPNPFQSLSVDPFPPEDWLANSPLLTSPFCLSLPPLSTTASPSPPLIADTGCTGILLQFSNFPPLKPLFLP